MWILSIYMYINISIYVYKLFKNWFKKYVEFTSRIKERVLCFKVRPMSIQCIGSWKDNIHINNKIIKS